MNRKRLLCLLGMLMAFSIVAAACGQVKQLNQITFITALGIDKTDKGVSIHALAVIPGNFAALGSESGRGAGQPNFIITAEGLTISEALYNLKRKSARNIELGHMKVVIFSQELCKAGLAPHLDIIMRREELQKVSWIAVVKGSTKEVLQVRPRLPESISDYLADLFSGGGSDTMQVLPIFSYQFYVHTKEPGRNSYAPILEVDKHNKNELSVSGLALFQKDKMIEAFLDPKETSYIQLIAGKRLRSATITYKGRSYIILGYSSHRKVTNSRVQVNIKLRLEVDQNSAKPLKDKKIKQQAEQELSRFLTNEMEEVIRKLQKLNTDPVGFGNYYRNYRHESSLNMETWLNETLPNMKVETEVRAIIVRRGLIK